MKINLTLSSLSQVVYTDPTEAPVKPPSRYLYTKEIAQCPTGESKMILTLLLQSLRWSDVSERKKEKAIKKLSRFFSVPRVSFMTGDFIAQRIFLFIAQTLKVFPQSLIFLIIFFSNSSQSVTFTHQRFSKC